MGRPVQILSHVPLELLRGVSERVPGVELVPVPVSGEPPAGVEGEVLLTFPWDTGNLESVLARGVRWVHAFGTGVDALPLELLGDRVLTCSRGASGIPIAEWVLAVMLAFEKQLPEAWLTGPPADRWSGRQLGGLHGRTLGLVGLGGIGVEVARRALPFGMRVRAVRRSDAPSPLPGVTCLASLEDLFASADHLVLAAPATRETRHLVDERSLRWVRPGVHLVNVARGSLVDHEALRAALDDGRVARASLDVADPEPLPAGHWCYGHSRVRLSPHVSWQMPGALDLLLDGFIENLERYRRGEALEGRVDPVLGY